MYLYCPILVSCGFNFFTFDNHNTWVVFYVYVYIYFVLSKFSVILNSSFTMIIEKSAGNDCLSLLAGISYQINHSC